jgi:hypothetical protein
MYTNDIALKAKIDESTEADFKSERLGKNLFQVH